MNKVSWNQYIIDYLNMKKKKIRMNYNPVDITVIYPVASMSHFRGLTTDFIFQYLLVKHIFKCSFV